MVAIIENWSKIKGTVLSFAPNDKLKEYYQIQFRLSDAQPINAFPNLAQNDLGKIITLNIKISDFKKNNISEGKEFDFTARKVSGSVYFIK